MLDAAKSLGYLHNNTLHRDVKQDNILVFSFVEVLAANWKQTDFGSSRNVNMLMTNMTFTKGDWFSDVHGAGGAEQEQENGWMSSRSV